MEQSKIEILYKILLNKQELSTSNLMKHGISKEDIELMIEQRILMPIKKDEFRLVTAEKFRQYGAKLLTANHTIEANRCFQICYELEPYGRNIAIQYMLSKIIKKKYDEAFEIFSKIELQHQEKYEKDNNLYLYLLGNITICPKEYQDKIRKLKPQDILLSQGVNTKVENEIRTAIARHKFKYAYQLINNRYSKERNYSLKFEVIRILVIQAISAEAELKENLLNLAKKENYNEIFSILTTNKQQRYLSDIELGILQITEAILNLINYQIIPTPSDIESKDMYEAIKNNNFKLALELNEEFLEYTQQDKNENTIYVLLTKLNDLIEKQLKEYKLYQEKMKHTETIEIETQTSNTEPEQTDFENDLKAAEELAYYISSTNIPLDVIKKKIGIIPEQVLLIKLIYARDYYIESNYDMGDKLLNEVLQSISVTPKILKIIQVIRENRDKYKNQLQTHSKKLQNN